MGLLLLDSFTAPPPVVVVPPPVVVPGPFLSTFGALVAMVDLTARDHLGGEPVIYRPSVGSPVTVTGIFDASYLLSQGTADAGVETLVPAVFLQLADLPTDPTADDPTLTIGGLDYRVIERRSADFGSIVLALRRLSA